MPRAPRRGGADVSHLYRVNRRRVYLGDIRAGPFEVREGGAVVTPYLGIWADADTGQVVSTVVALADPSAALARALLNPTQGLADAMAALEDVDAGPVAVAERYELPGRVAVFRPDLAEALRPALASRGIAVEVSERFEPFEDLFTSLFDTLGGAAPMALELPVEQLLPLCAVAWRFWRERPWEYCMDHPPIGVEPVDRSEPPVYAAILGAAEEVFGVALYTALDDYLALTEADDLDRPTLATPADVAAAADRIETIHRHRTYLVSFDPAAELDAAYRATLAGAGWSRRRAVAPSFMGHGGGEPPAFFSEADAARLTPVLEAVLTFCQRSRAEIPTIEFLPIQLAAEVVASAPDGERRYRVTMPPDMPRRRRRRR